MKKIYIAGPDVFEADSVEIGKRYVQICAEYGYEGMYPLDNIVDFEQDKQKIANDIFLANIDLIKKADVVIANLNAFRGKEADSGTVWECGYAYGLGKPVYGYMDCAVPYLQQFDESEKRLVDGLNVDTSGRMIEDFDYPINLMISCSALKIVEGGFEDVVKTLKENNFL
ncbi:nucleoside 2-deoxyribosyltransferase [Sulfurimonas sp. HSL3-2]|uniref:nucleoside 2-deoxyribosyltransferase n=1 Tax=Hydrocurvibacter mobilis TaxID=3131936 RepID=UPI0031F8D124